MKLLHTSPNKIEKIHSHGIFDDCLFFSCNEYWMSGNPGFVYSIEVSESDIISCSQLHDEEIIKDICMALDIDADKAEKFLDGRAYADGEDGWFMQARQGECAKKMGYTACRSRDEQGDVYIIPMSEMLHKFKLESK